MSFLYIISKSHKWVIFFLNYLLSIRYRVCTPNWDNFLLKNIIVFFLEFKFQNGSYLIKGLYVTYFSDFLATREDTWFLYLQHISLSSYSYVFWLLFILLTYLYLLNFCKNIYFIMNSLSFLNLFIVWLLVLILSRVILKQSIIHIKKKCWAKFIALRGITCLNQLNIGLLCRDPGVRVQIMTGIPGRNLEFNIKMYSDLHQYLLFFTVNWS